MNIGGYEVLEKLYESPNSIVYRAMKTGEKMTVIIKALNYEYPSEEKIAQLKYEYETVKDIRADSVIQAYEFFNYRNEVAIVYEDFNGISLDKLDFGQWQLVDKLGLFVNMLDALEKIHAKELIHKNISPANILFNSGSGIVKFIDFGNADRGNKGIFAKSVIEGTSAYISPEQTGRMNRAVDYRSDYYSLGATFYEVLAQQRLFPHIEDPAERIYYHLAKEATPLFLLDGGIPSALSDIVMKLLSKNPENRYQSILGIKTDLQNCINQLRSTGRIEKFPLAVYDRVNQFQVSRKIYGRNTELAGLKAAYEEVCEGGFAFWLICGPSGIGKSELVNELQKQVQNSKGMFVSGKFDEQRQKVPYSAIIDAVRDIIRRVLTENKETVEKIRELVQNKLGINGKVLTDVIPELEFLIGKQLPVEELPALESQNRFLFVFREFVTAFLGPKTALVLFLDDLQWSDNASLALIKSLVSAKENGYLLLIGSCRDNEVGRRHPLSMAINELMEQGRQIKKLKLKPLDRESVNELVADSLKVDKDICRQLSQVVNEKTDGNPFFVNEYLGQLYKKQDIYFDQEQLRWGWNVDAIIRAGFASSMEDLLVERIKSKNPEMQNILKLAAVIGNRFCCDILFHFAEGDRKTAVSNLWKAMKEGLIQLLETSCKQLKDVQIDAETEFEFAHDSIRQAVYSLLEAQEKKRLHLQVGHFIKTTGGYESINKNIFEMVTHFNLGCDLLQDRMQITELADLNYTAGKKAQAASAFRSALEYFSMSIELYGIEIWGENRKAALELYIAAAETAYSCAEYELMDRYSKLVFEKSDRALDRIRIYEIKILAILAQDNAKEAVETALEALELFGVRFPKRISRQYIFYKLVVCKISWYRNKLKVLSGSVQNQDEEKAAAMRLLTTVSSSAYLTAPELFVLMVLKQVEISMKYGRFIQTPFAYCMYGVVLCGLLNDIDNGYLFGKIGLEQLEKGKSKELMGKTLVVACIFVTHWRDKPQVILDELMHAYMRSLETGDMEYAAWALLCHGFHSFFAGKNIKKVSRNLIGAAEKIKSEFKQEKQYHFLCTFIKLAAGFHKSDSDKPRLEVAEYDEDKMLRLFAGNNDRNGLYYIYSNKMILNLFFGNYEVAVQAARMAEEYIDSVLSTIHHPVFYFYSTLVYLAVYRGLDEKDKKKIAENMKKIKKWAAVSPDNHQYKYQLLAAEFCRIEERYGEAAKLYDEAIESALQQGFIQEAALANELAAKCYAVRGNHTIAKAYVVEAYYFYQKWGADEKVRELERKNTYLINKLPAKVAGSWTGRQFLDTESIIKIVQLLSCEMKYENLIRKMMSILMENAGAQKGFFLLNSEEGLTVKAVAHIDEAEFVVVNGLNMAGFEEAFSTAMIQYVLRTQESLVIDNATTDNLFARDHYVEKFQPKSILCVPVLTKNTIMGVLYFENNLTTASFTQDRTELLKIVASLSATALENISIYNHLEEKVTERTREIEIQKAFFQQLFTASPDGILILDRELHVTNCNQAFQELFQYSLEEIQGRNVERLLVVPEFAGGDLALKSFESRETVRFETIRKRKDQSRVDVAVTFYPVMAKAEAVGLYIIYSDISARKQAERKLRYLSLHDSLTGMYNRAYFEAEMERLENLKDCVLGVIVCDIDGLKLINDVLGHDVGDRLLRAAAGVIKESLLESDIAARIGGDEFAVLLSHANPERLTMYAERIRAGVSRHNLQAKEYTLGISIGYAIKTADMCSIEDAFKEADANMYSDKLRNSAYVQENVLRKIMEILQRNDFFGDGHERRLLELAARLGERLGLPERMLRHLDLLAQFHDVGKVAVLEPLLFKREKLTTAEMEEIKKHCETGYRIAKSISEIKPVAEEILKHHEHWDGSGYPMGLAGDKIPVLCRIFAVVEAYEVMTGGRPYRQAITSAEALAELTRRSGTQFDPNIVNEFVLLLQGGL
jgi:diguanylate cyclase (GGDEF)-like protein/PAS domain S-box-containing protein